MEEKKQMKISLRTAIVLIMIVIIIMIGILVIMLNEIKQNNNEIGQNISTGNTTVSDYKTGGKFEIDFLKIENNKQNMIYSPLSIKYALSMLNEGAAGNTKIQIENVIKDLSLTKYNNIDDVLSLANGIYIKDTYSKYVKKDYTKKLTEKYNAEIKEDSFENSDNINKWIENKTLGKIKNMISDRLVQNQDTKMLLINALAIDMDWEERFDGSKTKGEEFTLTDGTEMIATTMNKETSSNSVSSYKDNTVTTLAIDLEEYEDTELQFMAIMPNKDLSNYIENLTSEDIDNIINKSKLAQDTRYGLDISIPRFSFDYDLQLKNDLINLGITDVFDKDSADFSNMSNEENGLYVSDALHKANIEFSEKGIKAAATTAMSMTSKAMITNNTKPEVIKIDKPFLYIIRDKNTGEIWFVGTVYEPELWNNEELVEDESDEESFEF